MASDQEFSRNACDGARENAKKANLRIVYDRTYPPTTADFTPIVRAIQAANPDVVAVCSYPLDSVGIVKAVNEIGFKPKMIGGAMVGLQATVFKRQLGPLLNGWVNYETWVPSEKLLTSDVKTFLTTYQARPAPRASIRSATISAPGAMPISRCFSAESKAPRASRMTTSPSSCAPRR